MRRRHGRQRNPRRAQSRLPVALIAAAALAVPAVACGSSTAFGGPTPKRYDRRKLEATLAKVEKPGLILGEFRLERDAVVDGDTIKVEGLETSLRLLGIDTEEKFFRKEDRRQFEMGWEHYLATKQKGAIKPVKMATPMGVQATKWAKQWFKNVKIVRLERDHPKNLRGSYGRYLCYVFAKKDGKWVNYNVEAVRAGTTPYFMKYGYSRRFHDEFVQAQKEARAAKRGIWDPDEQHYPDYDARLEWWTIRAEFIEKFEAEAEGKDNYIALGHWDAMKRLEENIGKPVELLATIGDIRLGDKGPHKVMLSRPMHSNFPLIYFDKDMFGSSGVVRWKGEFVRAQGTVKKYYNKWKKQHELQIIIDLPGQVQGPKLPWFRDAHDQEVSDE